MTLRPGSRHPRRHAHEADVANGPASTRVAAAAVIIEPFRPYITWTGSDTNYGITRRRRRRPYYYGGARGTPAQKRSGDHKTYY